MPVELARTFRSRLSEAEQKLIKIGEGKAADSYYPEKWTRKQVLGHLLDSAANNHVRFVTAAIDGKYEGPAYASDAWVKMHGYETRQWTVLLERWRSANAALAEVVERVPEEKLSAECRIGDAKPVTLKFVIEDYLDHLDQHVADIAG